MTATTPRTPGVFERHLSVRRCVDLLRADLIQYRNPLSVASASVFGTLLVILVASTPSAGDWNPHEVFVRIVLFGGGLIMTSFSFVELGDPIRRSAYLLIPASALEKLATRLLLTLIGFPLAVFTLYWVTSVVAAGLGFVIWGESFEIYDPFTQQTGRMLAWYLPANAIFFLGAVWFRKAAAFKTLLTLVLASIAIPLVAGLIFRIIFFDFFEGFSFTFAKKLSVSGPYCITEEPLFQICKSYTYVVLGPWLWIVSYLRLSDTEVR